MLYLQTAPYVVNRLSRFHRSAGLAVDGRSSSPILMSEYAVQSTAYANPRLPPFPHPTVVLPLTQLRQPSSLNSSSSLMSQATGTQLQGSKNHTRQRLHSTNEESYSKPLRVAAIFAKPRSWLLDPPGVVRQIIIFFFIQTIHTFIFNSMIRQQDCIVQLTLCLLLLDMELLFNMISNLVMFQVIYCEI